MRERKEGASEYIRLLGMAYNLLVFVVLYFFVAASMRCYVVLCAIGLAWTAI